MRGRERQQYCQTREGGREREREREGGGGGGDEDEDKKGSMTKIVDVGSRSHSFSSGLRTLYSSFDGSFFDLQLGLVSEGCQTFKDHEGAL